MPRAVSIFVAGAALAAVAHAEPAGAAPQSERPATRIEGQPLEGATPPSEKQPATKQTEAAPHRGPSPLLPPRTPSPQEIRRGEALVDLRERLFPPMPTESEVDRWGVLCGLGPDGIQTLRDLLADYREAMARVPAPGGISAALRAPIDSGATGPIAPDVDESALVAGAFEWDDATQRHIARFTPVMLQLLSHRAIRLEIQRRAEQDLGKGFLALASGANHAAARRIAFARMARVLAMPGDRGALTVDLLACVDETGLQPEAMALLSSTLDAHVKSMTAAMRRRAALAPAFEADLARLLVQLGPGWELVHDPDHRADMQERIDALRSAITQLDDAIRDVQYAGLTALSHALPPSEAMAVQDRFWQRARPDCFDDEAGLIDIVRAALEPRGGVARSHDEIASRMNLLAMTRLRLLPLGFDAAACADSLAMLASQHRADGYLHVIPLVRDEATARSAAAETLRLEVRRLDLMRQRRAICDDAATALRGMLLADETEMVRRIVAYDRDLEMRGRADAWTAARLSDRLGELRRIDERPPAIVEVAPARPADGATDAEDESTLDDPASAGNSVRPGTARP